MAQINRFYKNAAGDDLRIDTIIMEEKLDTFSIGEPNGRVWIRRLTTNNIFSTADRTVASIEVLGDFDSVETSSNSFIYATWNSPAISVSMEDLPAVNDEL